MGRDGIASRVKRSSLTTISGSLNEYFGNAADIPEAVLSGSEFSLAGSLTDDDGRTVEFDFPRVAPQSGMPGLAGRADVMTQVPFKVLSDQSLDEAAEPTIAITHSTSGS